MWGHAHVESADAVVLCMIAFCFATYDMDVIDVFLRRMTARESISFFSNCCIEVVSAWCHMSVVGLCMVDSMDSWSRDAASSSIFAYSIPGLHCYFWFFLSLCPTLSSSFPFS